MVFPKNNSRQTMPSKEPRFKFKLFPIHPKFSKFPLDFVKCPKFRSKITFVLITVNNRKQEIYSSFLTVENTQSLAAKLISA